MPAQPQKTRNKTKAKPEHLAVVDIGSNGVRLVVYRRRGRSYEHALDKKSTCRLAYGMKSDKPRLNPEGVRAALKTLRKFNMAIRKNGAVKVLAIGTAAMRAVAHTAAGQKFHREAEAALGYKITIVSGRKEAQLTACGVLSGFPKANGACGDLGGGSLELAAMTHGKIGHTATLTLGTLTLLGMAQGADAALHEADRQMGKVKWLGDVRGQAFYAVGGSWRALGRLMMKKQRKPTKYVHGFALKAAEAERYAREFAAMQPADFRGMQKKIRKRADIIPVAAAILAALLARMQSERVVFSAYGVREGLVSLS